MAYLGFQSLSERLSKQGIRNPAALAAVTGRKKYGAGQFNKVAAEGKSMQGMKPTA